MYCANCGKELVEGANFCTACGSRSAVAERMAAAAEAALEETGGVSAALASGRSRSRLRMSPLVLLVLVLALTAGIAAAAVYVYNEVYLPSVQGDSPTSDTQSSTYGDVESEQSDSPEEVVYHFEQEGISVDFPADWGSSALHLSARGHASGVQIYEWYFDDVASGITVARFDTMFDGSIASGETAWSKDPDFDLAWMLTSGDVGMSFTMANIVLEIWQANNGGQVGNRLSALSTQEQEVLLHLVVGDKLSVADVLSMTENEAELRGSQEISAYVEERILPSVKLKSVPDIVVKS